MTSTEVFIGTFARGTKTFRAALLLCDRGYGEQAAMLNRSLFEHTVVAWWMFVHEDSAELAARLQRHHDHAGVLHDRSVDRFPDVELDRVDKAATFSDDYIAALDKEFTRYGGP